jgi:hypothetical protein
MRNKMKKLISTICAFWVSVTVLWNANTETDLKGYRCYRSSVSGNYVFGTGSANLMFDVGAGVTSSIITNVPDDGRYYVLTAYDITGNESKPSNEVFYDPPPTAVKQITIVVSQ